jgi:DNA-binding helix-hairpin-helix protein with protein kinase domain
LVFLLVLLSLYMVSSSLFALYIVALPDMTPMRALRSARQLALHRRWTILRKILFLPFSLLLLSGLIMLPFIVLVPAIAAWVFLILSLFGWIVALTYMYLLYRELLNE